MNFGIVVQLAVDSLAAASLYALVALAVGLSFSGTGVVHMAIGQIGIAGGLVAAALYGAGWPVVIAAIAGIAVAAVVSGLADRTLLAPAAGRPLLGAVLLIGGGVVLRELLLGAFPRSAYVFPSTGGTFHVLGGLVHVADLVTIGVVLLVAATTAMLLRSSLLGAALRLTAAAPSLAERIGVDTNVVRVSAFAAGGALAAVAVLLGVSRFPLAATGGVAVALRGIAAAWSGGMRSPARIVGAALLIAAAEVIGGYFLGGGGEALSDIVAAGLIAVSVLM